MAVGKKCDKEGFHKMLLPYYGLIHPLRYEIHEIALAGYKIVKFSDIYRVTHSVVI